MTTSSSARLPRRRPDAVRRPPGLLTLAVLGVLGALALLASRLVTDNLWFDAIGFGRVFTTLLATQVVLFLLGLVVMGGLIGANLWLAYRLRPRQQRRGASLVLDRYRDALDAHLWPLIGAASLVFGSLAGLSLASKALPVLAWLHRVPVGVTDPYFHLDASFYMLELPLWRSALTLVLSALVVSLVGATIVHFAVGGIAPGRRRAHLNAPGPVARHLSILAALVMVGYGLANLLDRYALLNAQGPVFDGLQYTDDHARMGAKFVVAVIAFGIAAAFAANAFINAPVVPVIGVVLTVVTSLILSVLYPAAIQAFQVKPNEPDKERPYIAAHIAATRTAFGLDGVKVDEYPAQTTVGPGQLKSDAAALPGIRLMDPALIGPTFDQLQQVRGFYTFPDTLAVDRYTLNGQETDAVVAARELDPTGIPDKSWNNLHTVYTHGYGMASAYGNRRQANGEPVWITKDIPPTGPIEQQQSRIYFGQLSTQFAIVGREPGQDPIELDTPSDDSHNTYDGRGGVAIGNPLVRALYALRFSDANLLLSDRINSASKVLYNRTPTERVQAVAPWLTTDSTVYPAIVSGRLVWIVDGYTTSGTYPNAEGVSLDGAAADAQTRRGRDENGQINYIRNSVKAVVDAYDGTVSLYQWDEQDPLVRAYAAAFPGTLKAKSEIGPELLAHLRYPSDLFKVQRQMLARYHMTDPGAWYQQSDLWEIPTEPTQQPTATAKEPPYYLSVKMPGQPKPVFSLTTTFVPKGRQNLASYLAVNADAASPDYGSFRVLRLPDSHQIDGPGQSYSAIMSDSKVAQALRNYTSQGAADAKQGNLLTLPLGGGLLYVEPIYTVRTGNAGSYPVLTYVAVRFGPHVGIGATLQEALDQVFAGNAGANTGEGSTPSTGGNTTPTTGGGTTPPATAKASLQAASKAFDEADAALKSGDLAGYQAKVNEARKQLEAALKTVDR